MDKGLTKKQLRAAAAGYMNAWLASIPDGEDYTPSSAFVRGMEITRKTSYRRELVRLAHNAAAVLLALILTAAVLVAAIPSARAGFVSWVRTITGRSVLYTTEEKPSLDSIPGLRFRYIPKGFKLDHYGEVEDAGFRYIAFVNMETDAIFELQIHFGSQTEVGINGDYYGWEKLVRESVMIQGQPADYYYFTEKMPYNMDERVPRFLFWLDEDTGVFYRLEGYNIEKEDILLVAEGIELKEGEDVILVSEREKEIRPPKADTNPDSQLQAVQFPPEPDFFDWILHNEEEVNTAYGLNETNMERTEIFNDFKGEKGNQVDERLTRKANIGGMDFDVTLTFSDMYAAVDEQLLVNIDYRLDCTALSKEEIFTLVKQIAARMEEAYGTPKTRDRRYSVANWETWEDYDFRDDERHALWERWLILGDWAIPGTDKTGMLEAEVAYHASRDQILVRYILIWDETRMPRESCNEDGVFDYWL